MPESSPSKLYIGNVSYNFNDRELEDLFAKIGRIRSFSMKNGFAFVEYENEDDAKEAVNQMNDKELDGRRIRVEFTKPVERWGGGNSGSGGAGRGGANPPSENRHLFVANIPNGTSSEDVEDYFSQFGKIDGVKMLPQRGGASAQACFIDYVELSDAIKVFETKHELGGNVLRTDYNARRGPPPRRFEDRNDRNDRGRDRFDDRRTGGGRDRFDDRRGRDYDSRDNRRDDGGRERFNSTRSSTGGGSIGHDDRDQRDYTDRRDRREPTDRRETNDRRQHADRREMNDRRDSDRFDNNRRDRRESFDSKRREFSPVRSKGHGHGHGPETRDLSPVPAPRRARSRSRSRSFDRSPIRG